MYIVQRLVIGILSLGGLAFSSAHAAPVAMKSPFKSSQSTQSHVKLASAKPAPKSSRSSSKGKKWLSSKEFYRKNARYKRRHTYRRYRSINGLEYEPERLGKRQLSSRRWEKARSQFRYKLHHGYVIYPRHVRWRRTHRHYRNYNRTRRYGHYHRYKARHFHHRHRKSRRHRWFRR